MDQNQKIGKLFNPKSVAIVGASRTIGKWGFTFTMHLIRGGYKGEIYPVNPAGGELMGRKVYMSLSDIPGPVDLAFILLPPKMVANALEECGKIGVPASVVITAGFQEVGKEGRKLQDDVLKAANDAGIVMVGPNCAGVMSPAPMNFYCMMQASFPPPGSLAIVSQSGNIAGSVIHMCWKQEIGISRVVSVGNQAMLKAENFLEYLATDDESRVVALYLEGVPDGPRFMEAARKVTSQKPLIVIKGGRTASGTAAAKSHTGSIAGSDDIFEGMCRQCGIIRVDDVEDMIDTATAFLSQPLPMGNRVGIVANGGGWGVLIADACVGQGLDVVDLPEETLKELDKRLPAWWNRSNPVDMVAGMSRGAFFKAIEALAGCIKVDSVIAQGYGYGRPNTKAFEFIKDREGLAIDEYVKDALYSDQRGKDYILKVIAESKKPVILSSEYILGAEEDENEALLDLRRRNMQAYPSSQRPAKVLARMTAYSRYRQSLTGN